MTSSACQVQTCASEILSRVAAGLIVVQIPLPDLATLWLSGAGNLWYGMQE